jgi:hypothetical protein
VKFDYLTPDQRWAMFQQELTRLGNESAAIGNWEDAVRQLNNLTPGDFAVVARGYDLFGTTATAEALYQRLRYECAAKEALLSPNSN